MRLYVSKNKICAQTRNCAQPNKHVLAIMAGAAVAGVGLVTLGGFAGAAFVVGGGMVAATGYGGGWLVQKVCARHLACR
jgi:hypothetical protein